MGIYSGSAILLGVAAETVSETVKACKRPFQKRMKRKYSKQYNDETFFSTLAKEKKHIRTFSKEDMRIETGQGLFVRHVMEAYRQEGKEVRLILLTYFGRKALYFEEQYDMKMCEANIEEPENLEDAFQECTENKESFLWVNTSIKDYNNKKKTEWFMNLLSQKLQKSSEEKHVQYIIVHDQQVNKDMTLPKEEHIQYITMENEVRMQGLKEEDTNLYFSSGYGHCNTERAQEVLPGLPRILFDIKYSEYHHFIYRKNGTTGAFFMENVEKF